MLAPRALARFGRDFPDVEVRFEDGEPAELLTRLLEGDLDVIVVFRYDLVPQSWPAGSVRTPLLTEPVRLLVPDRAGAPSGPVPLTDFADASWISTREGTAGTLALERACAAAGFAPRIRYRSNDYDVVRSFVRAGLGVAAVPRLAYLGRVGLRDVDVTGLHLRRHVEALTMADRHHPAVTGMVDALRASAQADRYGGAPRASGADQVRLLTTDRIGNRNRPADLDGRADPGAFGHGVEQGARGQGVADERHRQPGRLRPQGIPQAGLALPTAGDHDEVDVGSRSRPRSV